MAAVPRAWAGVVIVSGDRETIVHSHVTYLDGFQPQGQPADQLSETTTVAPDLAPFTTATQTSSISTSSASGFTLSANGAGSLRTQAPGSTVRLNETWTYNLTAVTFQVTDQPETYTFHTEGVTSAAASMTGQPTLVNASFGVSMPATGVTGTLQPGVYTFRVETATKDSSDGFGKMLTAQSWPASYSNVTFNVTPEPVGLGVMAGTLVLLTRYRRRRRQPRG